MDVRDVGENPLMIACRDCDLNKVKILLDEGQIGINGIDHKQSTALMYAIASTSTAIERRLIIQTLIGAGADVNAFNIDYETPAILAAKNNDSKTLELLLNKGATNLERINMVTGKNVYQHAKENNIIDNFKNRQQQEQTLRDTPRSRSLFARVVSFLLTPFRIIKDVIKAIAAAVVQFFVDRSAKPRRDSDNLHDRESTQVNEPDYSIIPGEHSIFKNKDEASPKSNYDPNKEKKVHRFTSDIETMNREQGLKLKGESSPGSPRNKNDI